jgi:hypothetical protein
VIAGTAEANATVLVSLDGATLGMATADGSGNWSYSFTPTRGFSAGTYGFSAVARDLAGNVSDPSGVLKLQLGGKAPTATTPLLVNGVLAGLLGGGSANSPGTFLFVGLATPGSVVTILDGDVILGTTTASAFGTYSFVCSTLGSGKHTLSAEATNAEGLTGLLSGNLTFSV